MANPPTVSVKGTAKSINTTLDLLSQAAAAASMTSSANTESHKFDAVHQVLSTHATVIQQDNQKVRSL